MRLKNRNAQRGTAGAFFVSCPLIQSLPSQFVKPCSVFLDKFSQTFLIVLPLVLLWACSGDQKKPSPVTKKVDGIQIVLNGLADAYGRKDKEAFLSRIFTPPESDGSLRDRAVQEFEHFSHADLSMTIRRMEISEEALKTRVRWKGVWMSDSGAPLLKKKGDAVLFWTRTGELKLMDVRGESPFGILRNGDDRIR